MSSFLGRLTAAAGNILRGGSSTKKPVVARPKCSYGAKCYRKNPQHKADESHPGDPDYEEEDGTTPVTTTSEEEESANDDASAASVEEDEEDDQSKKKKGGKQNKAAAAPAKTKKTKASTNDEPQLAPVAEEEEVPAARAASPIPSASLISPTPNDSPVSSVGSTNSSPAKNDRKMSVKQRKAKQLEEAAAAAAAASSSTSSESPDPPPSAPISLPSLPSIPVASSTTSSSTPLLASLHAMFRTPLIPEFTEIRATSAEANSGEFLIGRIKEAKVNGQNVRVNLVLETNNPKLGKMISRVHAKITWQRTELPPPAAPKTAKRQPAGPTPPPAYAYTWHILDQGSVNGIFINHVKVSSTEPHPLSPDDRIVFGGGAGIAPGTFLKTSPAEAEFMFRFNCLTQTVDGLAVVKEEPEVEEKAAAASRPSKRTISTVMTPAVRPVIKRGRSNEGEKMAIQEEEKTDETEDDNSRPGTPDLDRPRSNESMPDADSATQNFGDDDDAVMADAGGATQDYHDSDREEAREISAGEATQDFGNGEEAMESGSATQDGGGMFE